MNLALHTVLIINIIFHAGTASISLADVPSPPHVIGEASPSARFVVRVVPGPLTPKSSIYAKAYAYELIEMENRFELIGSFVLKCKVAPLSMVVTDDPPRLVTFDDWGGGEGTENIAIYDLRSGVLLMTQKIEALLTPSVFMALPRTDGGVVWRIGRPQASNDKIVTTNAGLPPWFAHKGRAILSVSINTREGKVTFRYD